MRPDEIRYGAYSADVRIELRINGSILPVAQLANDFIMLDNPIEHPPTDAEIFMSIDGRASHWTVSLPEGLNPDQRRTPIASPQGG